MVAFVSLKPERIFRAVEGMYTAVAREPARAFHFPTGAAACLAVGYPQAELEGLPQAALESFAGVGWPFAAGAVRAGDVVLDLGSGSGTDALIAARRAGAAGRVVALDMTEAMRAKLAATLRELGVGNVEVAAGNAQAIPLAEGSVDVVTSNGVLNLVPDKPRAFAEICRVLKPGGRLQVADIALEKPIADKYRRDPRMWAECVVGAVPDEKYVAMLEAAGLADVEVLHSLDYFALSRSAETRTVAGLFGARSVVLRARKPHRAAAAAVPPELAARAPAWRSLSAGAVAFAVCASLPALLSALVAAGALALAGDGSLYPLFAACVALSLWLHWSTAREQAYLAPFAAAAACGAAGVAARGLLLAGLVPAPAWMPYAALGGMIAASLWSFVRGLCEDCVTQMVREAQRRA